MRRRPVAITLAFASAGALAGGLLGFASIRPSQGDMRSAAETLVPSEGIVLRRLTSGADFKPLRPNFSTWVEFTDLAQDFNTFTEAIRHSAIGAGWTVKRQSGTPAGAQLLFTRPGLTARVFVFRSYPFGDLYQDGLPPPDVEEPLPITGVLGSASVWRNSDFTARAIAIPAAAGALLGAAVGWVMAAGRGDKPTRPDR